MWDKGLLVRYSGPRYRRIVALIEDYIQQGLLVDGERLPAERRLAQLLEMNRSTVIHALDTLTERGILVRKIGSGTYVNNQKWGVLNYPVINWQHPVSMTAKVSQYKQKVQQIKHQARISQQTAYDLANGDLPANLLPKLSLPAMTAQELIEQEADPAASLSGLLSLKQHVIDYLTFHFAMTVDPAEILITSGTQQSLFLLSQGLLKPGDAVGIEAPSYFYSLPLFQAAGLRMYGIECDEEGVTVAGLDKVMTEQRLKWIFINPVFQNPTGRCMSLARKQTILDYCHQQCIGIIEDDAYSALYFDEQVHRAPIKQLDRFGQVIYLGSLSKYIGRHIRIGWMIAPAHLVRQLAEIRQYIDSGLSILPQLLAQDYLANHYQQHQQKLRTCLSQRLMGMHQWLATEYRDSFDYQLPSGGLHLYLKLRASSQITEPSILNTWLLKLVFIAQGTEFGDRHGHFRLSYGHFSGDLLGDDITQK
ncbi:PLP-dependent aminotransferase family protein [Utexia brackfieldae]|uniref:aminotransferase-like domain-containing protein n=1 Tax=Utexia brackfieldae TaxID=3074108 RepID=UPI00370D3AEE